MTAVQQGEYSVSQSSSTPCGIIDGYPLLKTVDVPEMLRSGVQPVSRPTDELVRYARTLETIVSVFTDDIDFKHVHESLVPHWCDLLEG